MIKLFRKIRYQLLGERKTGRYFKYAIGEIVLVVIGILIALQINTWNQQRIRKNAEIKLLGELKNDLKVTLKELDGDMNYLQRTIDSGTVMMERIEAGVKYETSFQNGFSAMGNFSPIWARSIAYDNLKSIGIDKITNDSIRFMVTELYGQRLLRVQAIQKSLVNNLRSFNVLWDKELIPVSKKQNGATLFGPKDFEQIKNNVPGTNSFLKLQNSRIFMLSIYNWFKELVVKLNNELEIELSKFHKIS